MNFNILFTSIAVFLLSISESDASITHPPSTQLVMTPCGGDVHGENGQFGIGSADYRDNLNCNWIIKTPVGKLITLTIKIDKVEPTYDYIEVKDGDNVTLVAKLWGTNIERVFQATSNVMYVRFHTDGSNTFAGFSATWTSKDHVIFKKTPLLLQDPISEAMTLQCTLRDIERGQTNDTREDVANIYSYFVNSILVMRNGKHMAMVAARFPPVTFTEDANLDVIGDVGSAFPDEGYLNLTWRNPTHTQTGNYTCEINAMNNAMGQTVVMSSSLEVNVGTPNFEEWMLYSHDLEEERKLTRSLKKKIAQLKSELHSEKIQTQQLTSELSYLMRLYQDYVTSS